MREGLTGQENRGPSRATVRNRPDRLKMRKRGRGWKIPKTEMEAVGGLFDTIRKAWKGVFPISDQEHPKARGVKARWLVFVGQGEG